jgi:exonuclease SbcC
MKIERIFIEQFGKHQDLELDFGPNFNLLLGPNESGKSTVLTFILAALYGLDSYTGKKDLQRNERSRFRPWSGPAYGGYLEVEKEGHHYRIERSFGDTKGKDKTTFINLSTGETIPLAKDEEPGAYLMGLDRDEFKNSVYMGQLSMAMESNDAIRAKLMEQSAGASLGSSVADLEAVLDQRRAELTRPRSKALLELSQDRILALEKEEAEAYETADRAKEARAQLGLKKDRLKALEADLALVEKQRQRAQALERRKAYRNLLAQQERVRDLEEEVRASVSGLGYESPEEIPDREERDLAASFIRKIQDYDRTAESLAESLEDLNEKIDSLGSPEFLAADEKNGLEGLEKLKEERQAKQKQKDDLARLELESQKKQAAQDRAIYEAQDALEKDQANLKDLDRVYGLLSDRETKVRTGRDNVENQRAEYAELGDRLNQAEADTREAGQEKDRIQEALASGRKRALQKLVGGLAFLLVSIILFVILAEQTFILVLAIGLVLLGLVFMGLTIAEYKKRTDQAGALESSQRAESEAIARAQDLRTRLTLAEDRLESLTRSLEEDQKAKDLLEEDLRALLPEEESYADFRERLEKHMEEGMEHLTLLRQEARAEQDRFAADIKAGQAKLLAMRPDEVMDEEEMVVRENIRHIQKKSDLLKALAKDLEEDKKALEKCHENRAESLAHPPALVGRLMKSLHKDTEELSGDLLEEAMRDFLKQITTLENRTVLLEEGKKTLSRAQGDLTWEDWAKRDRADSEILENFEEEPALIEEDVDLEEKSRALREEETDLHGQIGRLETGLENLLKETRVLQQIQEDLARAREDFASYKSEIADIDLAKEILDEVDKRMQTSFGPAINKKAGEILAYMTGEDRSELLIDREFQASIEDPLTRQMKELAYFSGGKIDQVYMAMRLAIALSLYQDEEGHKLPFIFDDSLIQFDKARASRALAYLVDLAREEDRQIIFATCHSAYGQMEALRGQEGIRQIRME